MELQKYSMGIGDRFGQQGEAQLAGLMQAAAAGVLVVPVWNKSYREHSIVGTDPAAVRAEADAATHAKGWEHPYYVDADHINLSNVDGFIDHADFFTLDVAEAIGQEADASDLAAFVDKWSRLTGRLTIPGIDAPLLVSQSDIEAIGRTFLKAVQEAGAIYRTIVARKGEGTFVTEVSMDETDEPQSPLEMLFILAMVADQGIPAQTIAPKFTGRFNKGVDYVGDVAQFETEFRQDLAVIRYATEEFGLPANLKLSVHSGSDKFSIYPAIHKAIREFDAGLHLKTAGTTWLEELIGLAEADGDGVAVAKEVYRQAYAHFDALCAPYATVIDIDKSRLPAPDEVDAWSASQMVNALRHDLTCSEYNMHLRQLLHVGYKIAATMGGRYLKALKDHEASVSRNVMTNIWERHAKVIFVGA